MNSLDIYTNYFPLTSLWNLRRPWTIKIIYFYTYFKSLHINWVSVLQDTLLKFLNIKMTVLKVLDHDGIFSFSNSKFRKWPKMNKKVKNDQKWKFAKHIDIFEIDSECFKTFFKTQKLISKIPVVFSPRSCHFLNDKPKKLKF